LRSKFSAMGRRIARFSALWPVRLRIWSSFMRTSKHQCSRVSIAQWERMICRAISRWQLSASTVTVQPWRLSILSSFGIAVISFDFASTAHQSLFAAPGGDHVQRRRALGFVERAAQRFTVNRHNALVSLGKAGHEALEADTELLRIQRPEQPAEGVVARRPVFQLQDAA
jgi:hypothetical protein